MVVSWLLLVLLVSVFGRGLPPAAVARKRGGAVVVWWRMGELSSVAHEPRAFAGKTHGGGISEVVVCGVDGAT
jgi:hypothetical protein